MSDTDAISKDNFRPVVFILTLTGKYFEISCWNAMFLGFIQVDQTLLCYVCQDFSCFWIYLALALPMSQLCTIVESLYKNRPILILDNRTELSRQRHNNLFPRAVMSVSPINWSISPSQSDSSHTI